MRSVRLLQIVAAALAALLLPSLASADGVAWTLNNVTLTDGGTASGAFNYDANANLYSSVNLSTTAGTIPGSPFTSSSYSTITDAVFFTSTVVGLGPNPFLNFNNGNLTGVTVLELMFLNPLTNAGGTDSIFIIEFLCNDSTCSSPATRTSLTGSATGTPISAPEPSSLFLLASALFVTFLVRRAA
jgi:hypothetical protein